MKRWLTAVLFVTLVTGGAPLGHSQKAAPDTDGDGLSDAVEQTILEQFSPTFMVSAQDCDVAPAQFVPSVAVPKAGDRNGTIYGQVFRSKGSTAEADVLEIHYYHLWAKDCGKFGHPLDVEHVAALVTRASMASVSEPWRATHWYAAAHQDTVCDTSSGATAAILEAADRGPVVWISSGKHASFFSIEDCRAGCGGDRCPDMKPLPVSALINIGEPGAPMNGANWSASAKWVLAEKMYPEFDNEVLAAIDSSEVARARINPESTAQTVILGGNAGMDAVAVGQQHTSNALNVGGKYALDSLKVGYRRVKKAISKGSE